MEQPPPSSRCDDLKSYFVGMGFSPSHVEKVIKENGADDANLLLEALFTYSKSSEGTPDNLDGFSSSDKEEENSPNDFDSDDNEEHKDLDQHPTVDVDNKSQLLMMNFSEREVDLAIDRIGKDATLTELVDAILATQAEDCSGETNRNGYVHDHDEKNEESTAETLFGTMDKTLSLIQMGFTEIEVSTAIDRFGTDVPILELADSIFANRIANRVVKKENDIHCIDKQNGSKPRSAEGASVCSEHSLPGTQASIFNATPQNYADKKMEKNVHRLPLEVKTTAYIKQSKQARLAEHEMASRTNFAAYNEIGSAGAELVKEEVPDDITPSIFVATPRNACDHVSNHPYFFYGNFVDVPQEIWHKLSTFLYGVKPEYANSQFFSAFIRREGYFHNLPTENRFRIHPEPPMSIEDALPHTKRWWPSWDNRKQLNSICSETTGVSQLCERLGRIMADSRGVLSKEQQTDILHHCKSSNLLWVGQHKLSSIEPNQAECILGYPFGHTQIPELEPSDRLKALNYSFQTDTLGYHLSVLKNMFPEGLKVLSVYSGIGGAEVALHKLGIHLKCVVSIEESETNQKILRRWWERSNQSGELKQIAGIEKLTTQKLERCIKQFGGFDLVIGGNPISSVTGTSIGVSSDGMDMNLFFEFDRVLRRVRSLVGQNG